MSRSNGRGAMQHTQSGSSIPEPQCIHRRTSGSKDQEVDRYWSVDYSMCMIGRRGGCSPVYQPDGIRPVLARPPNQQVTKVYSSLHIMPEPAITTPLVPSFAPPTKHSPTDGQAGPRGTTEEDLHSSILISSSHAPVTCSKYMPSAGPTSPRFP